MVGKGLIEPKTVGNLGKGFFRDHFQFESINIKKMMLP